MDQNKADATKKHTIVTATESLMAVGTKATAVPSARRTKRSLVLLVLSDNIPNSTGKNMEATCPIATITPTKEWE